MWAAAELVEGCISRECSDGGSDPPAVDGSERAANNSHSTSNPSSSSSASSRCRPLGDVGFYVVAIKGLLTLGTNDFSHAREVADG